MPVIRTINKDSLSYPDIPGAQYRFRPVILPGESPIMSFPENIWSTLTVMRD